jgi:hypothetical protein
MKQIVFLDLGFAFYFILFKEFLVSKVLLIFSNFLAIYLKFYSIIKQCQVFANIRPKRKKNRCSS